MIREAIDLLELILAHQDDGPETLFQREPDPHLRLGGVDELRRTMRPLGLKARRGVRKLVLAVETKAIKIAGPGLRNETGEIAVAG